MTPFSVTGWFSSNTANSEWCAIAGVPGIVRPIRTNNMRMAFRIASLPRAADRGPIMLWLGGVAQPIPKLAERGAQRGHLAFQRGAGLIHPRQVATAARLFETSRRLVSAPLNEQSDR